MPIYDSPKDDRDGRALARRLAAMSREQEQARRVQVSGWPAVGDSGQAEDVQPGSVTRYYLERQR